MLWAPLLTSSCGMNAPNNCYWTKCVRIPAMWILAFIDGQEGSITRTFDAITYLGGGDRLTITVDASPWGLGGILARNDDIIEYFADKISPDDEAIHNIQVGDHRAQQCLEGLATLVALRLWCDKWRRSRVLLHVRGDSITALTMTLELRAAGQTMSLIAREVALDVADALYSPAIVSHLPGLANTISDSLSRIFCPTGDYPVPPALLRAQRITCPTRTRNYYRTLRTEAAWARPLTQSGK